MIIFKKSFLIYLLILLVYFALYPIAEEFGFYRLFWVLQLGLFFDLSHTKKYIDNKSSDSFIFLNFILISSLYLSVNKIRINDGFWSEGLGAYLTSQIYHFKGLVDLGFLSGDISVQKVIGYLVMFIEVCIGIFVLTPWRKFAFYMGIFFHFALLLTISISSWQLVMILYYVVLLSDCDVKDFSFSFIKDIYPINRAKLNDK